MQIPRQGMLNTFTYELTFQQNNQKKIKKYSISLPILHFNYKKTNFCIQFTLQDSSIKLYINNFFIAFNSFPSHLDPQKRKI